MKFESRKLKIVPAGTRQLYAITCLTRQFFPYINMNMDKVYERQKEGVIYLAALYDGHTIGFIDLELIGSYDEMMAGKKTNIKHTAKILGFAVSPEFQGHGVGKALFRAALAEAKKRKAKSTVLLVEETNPIRKFYEEEGFKIVGKLERKIWDKEIVMMTRTM